MGYIKYLFIILKEYQFKGGNGCRTIFANRILPNNTIFQSKNKEHNTKKDLNDKTTKSVETTSENFIKNDNIKFPLPFSFPIFINDSQINILSSNVYYYEVTIKYNKNIDNRDKLPEKLYYKGDYIDRTEWINKMRQDGHFRFDNSENNIDVENLINNFKSDYESGELAISKDEYENQLKIYEQMRSLGDLPEAMEYLEDISPFKLNCEIDVSEEDFYNYSQEVRIVRGYPIYASCN